MTRTLTVRGLFRIKDFAPYLGKSRLARAARQAAQQCRRTHATVVLTGDAIDWPAELAWDAVHSRLRLSDVDELREAGKTVLASVRRRQCVDATLDPEDLEQMLGGLSGFTVTRARLGFTAEAAAMNQTPPRGFIVGVKGCGKSLAAQAIAREGSLPLLTLDAGRLFDKYIGETEKNLGARLVWPRRWSPPCFGLTRSRKDSVEPVGRMVASVSGCLVLY